MEILRDDWQNEIMEEGKQRLFNEDMHDNLRAMGERGEIKLFNEDEIKTLV